MGSCETKERDWFIGMNHVNEVERKYSCSVSLFNTQESITVQRIFHDDTHL